MKYEMRRMKSIDKVEIVIRNIEEIDEKAREFINALGNHRVVAFYGSMGAGKTTFIRALCQTLGVHEPVTSPTFAIVNEYEGPIYHFDFYRIRRLEEAFDIGFEDYLYSGHLCLIEWPELIEELLPDDTVQVYITINPDGSRTLSCVGIG